jgi:hypothetical protein
MAINVEILVFWAAASCIVVCMYPSYWFTSEQRQRTLSMVSYVVGVCALQGMFSDTKQTDCSPLI